MEAQILTESNNLQNLNNPSDSKDQNNFQMMEQVDIQQFLNRGEQEENVPLPTTLESCWDYLQEERYQVLKAQWELSNHRLQIIQLLNEDRLTRCQKLEERAKAYMYADATEQWKIKYHALKTKHLDSKEKHEFAIQQLKDQRDQMLLRIKAKEGSKNAILAVNDVQNRDVQAPLSNFAKVDTSTNGVIDTAVKIKGPDSKTQSASLSSAHCSTTKIPNKIFDLVSNNNQKHAPSTEHTISTTETFNPLHEHVKSVSLTRATLLELTPDPPSGRETKHQGTKGSSSSASNEEDNLRSSSKALSEVSYTEVFDNNHEVESHEKYSSVESRLRNDVNLSSSQLNTPENKYTASQACYRTLLEDEVLETKDDGINSVSESHAQHYIDESANCQGEAKGARCHLSTKRRAPSLSFSAKRHRTSLHSIKEPPEACSPIEMSFDSVKQLSEEIVGETSELTWSSNMPVIVPSDNTNGDGENENQISDRLSTGSCESRNKRAFKSDSQTTENSVDEISHMVCKDNLEQPNLDKHQIIAQDRQSKSSQNIEVDKVLTREPIPISSNETPKVDFERVGNGIPVLLDRSDMEQERAKLTQNSSRNRITTMLLGRDVIGSSIHKRSEKRDSDSLFLELAKVLATGTSARKAHYSHKQDTIAHNGCSFVSEKDAKLEIEPETTEFILGEAKREFKTADDITDSLSNRSLKNTQVFEREAATCKEDICDDTVESQTNETQISDVINTNTKTCIDPNIAAHAAEHRKIISESRQMSNANTTNDLLEFATEDIETLTSLRTDQKTDDEYGVRESIPTIFDRPTSACDFQSDKTLPINSTSLVLRDVPKALQECNPIKPSDILDISKIEEISCHDKVQDGFHMDVEASVNNTDDKACIQHASENIKDLSSCSDMVGSIVKMADAQCLISMSRNLSPGRELTLLPSQLESTNLECDEEANSSTPNQTEWVTSSRNRRTKKRRMSVSVTKLHGLHSMHTSADKSIQIMNDRLLSRGHEIDYMACPILQENEDVDELAAVNEINHRCDEEKLVVIIHHDDNLTLEQQDVVLLDKSENVVECKDRDNGDQSYKSLSKVNDFEQNITKGTHHDLSSCIESGDDFDESQSETNIQDIGKSIQHDTLDDLCHNCKQLEYPETQDTISSDRRNQYEITFTSSCATEARDLIKNDTNLLQDGMCHSETESKRRSDHMESENVYQAGCSYLTSNTSGASIPTFMEINPDNSEEPSKLHDSLDDLSRSTSYNEYSKPQDNGSSESMQNDTLDEMCPQESVSYDENQTINVCDQESKDERSISAQEDIEKIALDLQIDSLEGINEPGDSIYNEQFHVQHHLSDFSHGQNEVGSGERDSKNLQVDQISVKQTEDCFDSQYLEQRKSSAHLEDRNQSFTNEVNIKDVVIERNSLDSTLSNLAVKDFNRGSTVQCEFINFNTLAGDPSEIARNVASTCSRSESPFANIKCDADSISTNFPLYTSESDNFGNSMEKRFSSRLKNQNEFDRKDTKNYSHSLDTMNYSLSSASATCIETNSFSAANISDYSMTSASETSYPSNDDKVKHLDEHFALPKKSIANSTSKMGNSEGCNRASVANRNMSADSESPLPILSQEESILDTSAYNTSIPFQSSPSHSKFKNIHLYDEGIASSTMTGEKSDKIATEANTSTTLLKDDSQLSGSYEIANKTYDSSTDVSMHSSAPMTRLRKRQAERVAAVVPKLKKSKTKSLPQRRSKG